LLNAARVPQVRNRVDDKRPSWDMGNHVVDRPAPGRSHRASRGGVACLALVAGNSLRGGMRSMVNGTS
jgi:hypothetical protein